MVLIENRFDNLLSSMVAIVIETFAAVCILQTVGTLSMAAMAKCLGASISEVSIGYGPLIASFGRLKVRLLPISGTVKLQSVADAKSPQELARAFDLQPLWKPVLFHLSGPAILALFAVLLAGQDALDAFGSGFGQIFIGAIRPFSVAQTYLNDYAAYAESHGTLDVLTIIAAKLAALNLVPIIPTSSFIVLFLLICRLMGSSSREVTLPIWTIMPTVVFTADGHSHLHAQLGALRIRRRRCSRHGSSNRHVPS